MRILLVEDEQGLIITLTDRLKSEGFDVETAPDGRDGFEKASTATYDLIILDEILGAVSQGQIDLEQLLDLIRSRSRRQHPLLTGAGEVMADAVLYAGIMLLLIILLGQLVKLAL